MSTAPGASPGLVALVTGGATRLGLAITEGLLAHGWRVWVHHHASEPPSPAPGLLGAIRGDLTRAADREALCRAVLDGAGPERGRLDLLVNNAASFESGRFVDRTDADLARVLELNLVAPLSLTRALAPALSTGPGSVVNLLDLGAIHPWSGRLDHCVAKAGLAAATRALAVELAPVRVNGIAPGTVLPPEGTTGDPRPVPRGRIGAPSDVVGALLYMASAPHVSGQVLAVDGGRLAAVGGPYGDPGGSSGPA